VAIDSSYCLPCKKDTVNRCDGALAGKNERSIVQPSSEPSSSTSRLDARSTCTGVAARFYCPRLLLKGAVLWSVVWQYRFWSGRKQFVHSLCQQGKFVVCGQPGIGLLVAVVLSTNRTTSFSLKLRCCPGHFERSSRRTSGDVGFHSDKHYPCTISERKAILMGGAETMCPENNNLPWK